MAAVVLVVVGRNVQRDSGWPNRFLVGVYRRGVEKSASRARVRAAAGRAANRGAPRERPVKRKTTVDDGLPWKDLDIPPPTREGWGQQQPRNRPGHRDANGGSHGEEQQGEEQEEAVAGDEDEEIHRRRRRKIRPWRASEAKAPPPPLDDRPRDRKDRCRCRRRCRRHPCEVVRRPPVAWMKPNQRSRVRMTSVRS